MKQYIRIYKILFGAISCSFFLYIRARMGYSPNHPLIADLFFLFSGYLFIYFVIFSLIESGIDSASSFHQKYNQKNIHRQPLKYLIENKSLVSNGYKLIFNLGYILIAFLALKHYILK
ncbi:hypothetical protein LVQ78_22260 [Buttiauxella sp. A2-C2_NF]|uniref:hypothetical protein n=1 Tax=Buttiauxella ferragutiae TaxID=82989 RepID=UPI001E4F8C6C|nr:hypothetical protein [Buttiauxella ferragutiae]MCE0828732.1 hypothetical protein [Buttiauxella ferragutiae]